MGNPIGARQCGSFKAVSTAPSVNKTPVGCSTPPLPYPTVQDLANSVSILPSVLLNGDPVYVLSQSTQPSCKGDDAGTALGVRSGTVNGEVKPVKGSTTVRAGGKNVVREQDPCTMNGGNNPGIYVTTQVPNGGIQNGSPTKNTDPPIKAETPQEEGWLRKWWNKAKEEVPEALRHPFEGTKGGAKDLANMPSEVGEVFMKGSALQGAADMEQAAAWQSLFGQKESAQALTQAAQQVRASADAISLPKFQMSNPAQAGGAKITTAVTLIAGGAGLLKSGAKGLSALGKAGAAASEGAEAAKGLSTGAKAADAVADAGKGAEAAKGVSEGAKAADAAAGAGRGAEAAESAGAVATSPGNGVKVAKRVKSLREKYLGRTPGKGDRTGREVQERMRAEGTLRDGPKGTEFKASDGEWYPLKEADMAHRTDAVKWWNETGRQYGAKAPEVRTWMLDSKNYVLDHFSLNRSAGASLPDRYLPPLK